MRKVFISGATRGIGRETAFEFARNGYCVILNGLHKNQKSEQMLGEIKKISPEAEIYYFDVSVASQVKLNCQKILKKHHYIDILVNNAGILRDKTLLKMTNKDWDQVVRTNLYGPFYLCKNLLPSMIKRSFGRIINISSVVALSGNFGQTNYAASKAGLIGFTKSLAKETAKFNITVNSVCPGLVDTDILKKVPRQYLDKMLEKIPLKRMAETGEIAKLIFFLASEKSSYITGSVININGGWT